MLGGIDPADPAAAEELAARLRRQTGWNRVDNKGDGLFDVSFSLTGRIDHDFLFPTIEGFPRSNFFVVLSRRQGGTVRIEAPGFVPQSRGNPFEAMMAGGRRVAWRSERWRNGRSQGRPHADNGRNLRRDHRRGSPRQQHR